MNTIVRLDLLGVHCKKLIPCIVGWVFVLLLLSFHIDDFFGGLNNVNRYGRTTIRLRIFEWSKHYFIQMDVFQQEENKKIELNNRIMLKVCEANGLFPSIQPTSLLDIPRDALHFNVANTQNGHHF